MSRTRARDSFRAHFRTLAEHLPGSDLPWLRELRSEAMETFEALDLPTTRAEDWRFTPLTPLAETEFRAVDPLVSLDVFEERPETAAHAIGDAHRLVFVNGRLSPTLSSLDGLPDGVRVLSLAETLAREPERIRPRLGQLADPKLCAFWALNTALTSDGVVLDLEPEAILARPLHAVFIQHADGEALAMHPRNLVIAGPGSQATIVEHHIATTTAASLTNSVSEVFLGRGARLQHVKLQEEAEEAYHIAGLLVHQEADSRFASHSISIGARIMRFDIRTTLLGEGAECTLNGLFLGCHRQLVDHHTSVDHASPRTTSRELYRGILDGRARGVFHGRIRVRPDAQKIDASQNNKNLLLSEGATINTKPQLEIYADDVLCSHGAAVGRLDEDALFYLRSRGIGLDAARALLTFAFANEVTQDLPFLQLREYLEAAMLMWLPRAKGLA